jgi:hypothetical protein
LYGLYARRCIHLCIKYILLCKREMNFKKSPSSKLPMYVK